MTERRKVGKVDKLPSDLKDTVEQMLLTGSTYKEIVAFLRDNGEVMSQMAICTYAKKYRATVEMLNVAQENFNSLVDLMNKYPDIDTSEALIRLSSHHVMNALSSLSEEDLKMVPVDKLIKESNSLIKATAYKKRIQIQNQEDYEKAVDEVKAILFEMMKKEKPDLYRQVNEFLNEKKREGA
ncbi:MAG: DUF3486 family protein [Bacillota bacterium]|nr:DUF3486 family protein [Bacillota bacterium]